MFGVCPYLNKTKRILMKFTLYKLFFILSFSRKKKRGKRARLPYLRNIYYKTQVCVQMTKRRRFFCFAKRNPQIHWKQDSLFRIRRFPPMDQDQDQTPARYCSSSPTTNIRGQIYVYFLAGITSKLAKLKK